MLKSRKIVAVCTILAVLAGISTAVFAAKQQKQLTVTYGMTLYFNEQKSILQDAAGAEVQPFVYQGTTYVPIRGVSQLFGAAVSYDPASNSAYIYDDFSEACAVVYRMSNIVNNCYLLYQDMILNASTKELKDLSALADECDQDIYDMFDLLENLYESNANIAIIIEDVLPSYSDFLESYAEAYNAYKSLRISKSSYAANKFVDSAEILIDNYYATTDSIDNFFNNYCCWRDIGF